MRRAIKKTGLKTWLIREIERRPEGAKLKDLKDLKQKAIDVVMESGTPDELKQSLNLVVKNIGLTWNVDTSKIKF